MTARVIEAVGLIAIVCNNEGPTAKCREVLEVAVCDFGGNEYGRAATPAGVSRIQKRLRIATRLKAVKLGKEVDEQSYLSGYTVDCGYCD
jgi:hypothetical protein